MRHAPRYVSYAVEIIDIYGGEIPLTGFLKSYFAAHKKFGSRDRKYITHLCYCFYRLGKYANLVSREEAIRIGLFLCNKKSSEWVVLFDENWLNHWELNSIQKLCFIQSLYPSFFTSSIFPFVHLLSKDIDPENFAASFLMQPDLFLRIRPGKLNKVKNALNKAGIAFHSLADTSLSFSNSTKLVDIIELDKDAVVQDYSSQRVGEMMKKVEGERRKAESSLLPSTQNHQPKTISVWDCCAASGGKSILANDIFANIKLTVSDIRPSILHNLKTRFENAGVNHYHSFVIDLSKKSQASIPLKDVGFDLILCDAPCTGSGTWSRTPEQLYFFDEKKILGFQKLQENIVSSVIPFLKQGGFLLYITCSVFENENEHMVDFIQANSHLLLIDQLVIKGDEFKADSMFVALFRRLDVEKKNL
jgi:16S rRNA (cytosine967-C5)-methyltransferase